MQNKYLNNFIKKFIAFTIPKGKSHLVINSKNRKKVLKSNKLYDYIFVVCLLEKENNILKFLEDIYSHLSTNGRIIIIYRNYLHTFFKEFAGTLLNNQNKKSNWISTHDLKTFLHLTNFDLVIHQPLAFTSTNIPLLTSLINHLLLYLFPFNHASFLQYIIARKKSTSLKDTSVSIIIPARNEAGTISKLITSLPALGTNTEVIFIEGHSTDNTKKIIKQNIQKFQNSLPFSFKLISQGSGKGKADAIHKGFAKATGEILIIYDADLSIKASQLKKFYMAILANKGDFINGSRLIYPMQGKAMQFLNILGNKFFSILYSWIFGQKIKDTLCGTKALWKKDYQKIKTNPIFKDMYDPFGDFSLLTGACKLNLKIIDLPVRYYERTYGSTNIKRFINAWELAKYSFIAIKKLKMRLP